MRMNILNKREFDPRFVADAATKKMYESIYKANEPPKL